MNLKVVDFDIITRSFIPYVDGVKEIENFKNNFIKSIEPQKKELESIIRSQTSGLIIDEITQKSSLERFKSIQEDLMKRDQDFKTVMKKKTDELNTGVFDKLSEMITEWSVERGIDLVMGKMEVIFSSDKVDATNDILELLKSKNLYVSQTEKELQE